jgi:hypothetical protein
MSASDLFESEGAGESLLLFQNLTSAPSVSFWRELARRKLDELGLDDAAIPIVGTFRVGTQQHAARHRDDDATDVDAASDAAPPILFDLSESSFVGNAAAASSSSAAAAATAADFVDAAGMLGLLFNFNTVEAFKRADKNQVLRDCALRQGGGGSGGSSRAPQFVVLGYADLKKHTFVYWVGFPTLRLDRPQLPRLLTAKNIGGGSSGSSGGGTGGSSGGVQPLSTFMPAAETRRQLAAQLFALAAPPSPPPAGGGEGGRWTMPLHFAIVCSVVVDGDGDVVDDAARGGGSSSGEVGGFLRGCHAVDCTVHQLEELPRLLLEENEAVRACVRVCVRTCVRVCACVLARRCGSGARRWQLCV